MDTYGRFLFEFLDQFFSGFKDIFIAIFNCIKNVFNFPEYFQLIQQYSSDFGIAEWMLTGLAILALAIVIIAIIVMLAILIKKLGIIRKKAANQEELLGEINRLNNEVETLVDEKMKILSMQNPELGIDSKNFSNAGASEKNETENKEEEEKQVSVTDSRFSKLTMVDIEYAKYKQKDYKNTFDLKEFCYRFRNFAASKLHLYYSENMIRLFVSAIASTKLVILQGISGTGKTSISLAWGKFVKHPCCVASVQPSWRDRTDIFGYLNEFTKKFNETDFLSYLYTAGYTDEIYTVILDEMNLARDEWLIEIVQSVWPTDPKKLINGKLHVPPNCWYIGTINNDDSTFMVTDKVYDRAMPIDLNEKGTPFDYDEVDALDVNYSYLNGLFESAKKDCAMSEETNEKIEKMDNYTIKHFRVAFGNRIVKHMRAFVPVYVACGGDETAGVDYFMAKKVLRKFEALNLALIRDEIDGYIEFLDSLFGKGKMPECTEFLLRLKKMG